MATSETAAAGGWARGIRVDGGLAAMVGASACFGTSGAFAKSLIQAGWTPATIGTARVGIAGLVLLGPALYAVRGRRIPAPDWWLVVGFGATAVAGAQLGYFNAVQRLPVGIALLLEYLGVVLVVLWVWLRSRQAPAAATLGGMALAVVGLLLVLDLRGAVGLDPIGVAWGMVAAVGLATFYLVAGRGDSALPPVAMASFGMLSGCVALAGLTAVGLLPAGASTAPVLLHGAMLPWWLAIAELALIAAAAAYTLGAVGARRLGATVSSFVGLSEVLFAVGFAWLLLGELPTSVQLGGGVLILAGVAAVRMGELRARTGADS